MQRHDHNMPDHPEFDQHESSLLPDALDDYFQEHVEMCATCREFSTITGNNADAGNNPGATSRKLLAQAARIELLSEPEFLQAVSKLQQLSIDETLNPSGDSARDGIGVGSQIGRYQLVEDIARGGMGQIYRAVHVELNKVVAVKLLPPERELNASAIDRFRREMKVLGQFSHHHVVMATDGGEEQGRFYLVMEFVEGFNLSELVKSLGPLPVADAAELIRQAALGVAAIHQQGFVHRDLKPSNIMLSAAGVVKVLDLGLSRFSALQVDEEDLTATGQILGTKRYMAPEQFETSQVDARADLYSLAATLGSLLSGGIPLLEESHGSGKTTKAGWVCSVGRQLSAREDVPPALLDLLNRFTARRPADRPGSARELIAALEPFCTGCDLPSLLQRATTSPVVAAMDFARSAVTSQVPRQTTQQGFRRSRRLVWGLLLTVLITVGFWFGIASSERSREPTPDVLAIDPTAKQTASQGASQSKELRAQPKSLQEPIEQLQERQIAEWALEKGGQVVRHPHGDLLTAEDIPQEGPFRIRSLSLVDRGLVDDDILLFRRLSMVDTLILANNFSLTDRGLNGLCDIQSLRWLYVGGTQISDDALHSFNRLSNLESLGLGKTDISGAGLAMLVNLNGLRELQLNQTRVSDSELRQMKNFPNLIKLNLSSTRVTDEGLRQLVESAGQLESLQLQFTKITDVGIPHLSKLRQLKELSLEQTALSPQGVESLRQTLTHCRVKF